MADEKRESYIPDEVKTIVRNVVWNILERIDKQVTNKDNEAKSDALRSLIETSEESKERYKTYALQNNKVSSELKSFITEIQNVNYEHFLDRYLEYKKYE